MGEKQAPRNKERSGSCPNGKPEGRIVICSRPPEETGAWPQSATVDRTGWIVTSVFCRQRCPLFPK